MAITWHTMQMGCCIAMSGFKRCSQMCVLALLLLAWLVLCGMQEGKDVQTLIIGYWAVLTIKNLIDWIGGKMDG